MSATIPPRADSADGRDPEPRRRGLLARVSLGASFSAPPIEFLLLASTAIILTGFGAVMVLSATSVDSIRGGGSPFAGGVRHGIFVAVGIPLMFVISRFPVKFLQRTAWLALIGGLLLQLLVFTPIGYGSGGNRNWIRIGGLSAQPAEFLKLGFILWLGFVLWRKRDLLRDWKHVLIPFVPVTILVIGSIMAGRDLGTGMIVFLIALGALFFAGVKLRIFIWPVLLSVIAVVGLAVASPNRMRRIMSFLDEDCNYFDECYQPMHGLWALADGGVFGLGLGNSKQKYGWLPAAADDYIFAIVGEELGLVGCAVVLGLFGLYAYAALRIVRRTDSQYVRVIAGATAVWIIGQALINIGVVLRVFPVLGVPLPFLSSGGTSLFAVLMATGVLMALSRTLPPVDRAPAVAAESGSPRRRGERGGSAKMDR